MKSAPDVVVWGAWDETVSEDALLAGFVQDALIDNQNHRHKTDKIIARTLLFSKNQKTVLTKTLVKKDFTK